MGIGAYECREYVHSLGGMLRVESVPGKGTRMQITLPLSAGQQPGDSKNKPVESAG